MRKSVSLILCGVALVATPAMAQLGNLGAGVGANVGVNTGVGVNAGNVVNGVQSTLDRTVNAADRAVNRTASTVVNRNLTVATSADVVSGLAIRDMNGKRIGTVQSVSGDTAIVVQGNRQVRVPVASLYKSSKGLVTNLTRSQLLNAASANLSANANADASVNR